jgi:hypothetical protein
MPLEETRRDRRKTRSSLDRSFVEIKQWLGLAAPVAATHDCL